MSTDKVLDELTNEAEVDPEYQRLLRYIRDGFPDKKKLKEELQGLHANRDNFTEDRGLAVLGIRVFVPRALRREILQRLHI